MKNLFIILTICGPLFFLNNAAFAKDSKPGEAAACMPNNIQRDEVRPGPNPGGRGPGGGGPGPGGPGGDMFDNGNHFQGGMFFEYPESLKRRLNLTDAQVD